MVKRTRTYYNVAENVSISKNTKEKLKRGKIKNLQKIEKQAKNLPNGILVKYRPRKGKLLRTREGRVTAKMNDPKTEKSYRAISFTKMKQIIRADTKPDMVQIVEKPKKDEELARIRRNSKARERYRKKKEKESQYLVTGITRDREGNALLPSEVREINEAAPVPKKQFRSEIKYAPIAATGKGGVALMKRFLSKGKRQNENLGGEDTYMYESPIGAAAQAIENEIDDQWLDTEYGMEIINSNLQSASSQAASTDMMSKSRQKVGLKPRSQSAASIVARRPSIFNMKTPRQKRK